MPDRCQTVVQTDHGRTRCANDGIDRVLTQEHRLTPVWVCAFHASNPTSPQCVGPRSETDGSRCLDVAVIPPENPQFCTEHNPSYNRPAVQPQRHGEIPNVRTERWIDENLTVAGYNTTAFVLDEPVVLPPLASARTHPIAEIRADQEHADAMRFSVRRDINGIWSENDRVEVSMPSVNFSQTAIPFVAALVERMGGDITVPARTMRNAENLTWNRVSNGIRFQIMRAGEVVRSMPQTPEPVAPVQVIERKYEVEKVIDEEDVELRKLLLRCEECGLQFEKTHKTARGTDECPYCTVRLLESAGKSTAMQQEVERLGVLLWTHERDGIAYATKIARLEQMVQEKIDAVNAKSSEIRTLREALERRGIATAPTPLPRPAAPATVNAGGVQSGIDRIRELRANNPGMGLLEARNIEETERRERNIRITPRQEIPRAGGVRARIEQVAREFGGQVNRHAMTVDHPGMRGYEVHNLEFVVPLQSHLETGSDRQL